MRVLWILSAAVAVAGAFQRTNDHGETVNRIAHGEMYDHEKYQYVVAVIIAETFGGNQLPKGVRQCTGTLVSRLIVLTAAHCTDGAPASGLTVYPGSLHDRFVGVRHVRQHPEYNKSTQHADISLLKIKRPFPSVKRYASIAGLPADFVNGTARKCVAIGFGLTMSNETSDDGQIIHVTIKYGDDSCVFQNDVENATNKDSTELEREFLCSVPDIHTVCPGDSGGPLICGEHQYGVTSHSVIFQDAHKENALCGSDRSVDRYVFLRVHNDWIASSMEAMNDGRSLHRQLFVAVLVTCVALCVQN